MTLHTFHTFYRNKPANYELAREFNGGKQMRNLWTLSASKHLTIHPTEKPENLLRRIILIGSKEGDTVLDPFMGSGTTGVVAKQLGRNFIGIEIDQSYFEIATQRIDNAVREPNLFATSQSKRSTRHCQLNLS
jgi:site-specific DNA-methyltransferase (adenine-specific)